MSNCACVCSGLHFRHPILIIFLKIQYISQSAISRINYSSGIQLLNQIEKIKEKKRGGVNSLLSYYGWCYLFRCRAAYLFQNVAMVTQLTFRSPLCSTTTGSPAGVVNDQGPLGQEFTAGPSVEEDDELLLYENN
jgi:hypothetical protein